MSKKFILLAVVMCLSWTLFIIVAAGRSKATFSNFPYLEPLPDTEYEEMIAKTVNEQMKGIPITINYLWFIEDNHPEPLELLRFLATKQNVIVQHLTKPDRSLRSEIYEGWIGKEDIDELIKYIKSNQPAAAIESGIASFPHKSTVGKEAILMIEAYRARPYPVGLGNRGDSYPPNVFGRNALFKEISQEERVKEIQEWWETEKNEARGNVFPVESETTHTGKVYSNAAIGWD